jgi:hypothetical protein
MTVGLELLFGLLLRQPVRSQKYAAIAFPEVRQYRVLTILYWAACVLRWPCDESMLMARNWVARGGAWTWEAKQAPACPHTLDIGPLR